MSVGDNGEKVIGLHRLRWTDDESGEDVSCWCWVVGKVGDAGEMGDVGWDCKM